MPVWQLVHASPLCLPASWNSLIGAWQPKQPLASKLACFFAGAAALATGAADFVAGADCAYASGIVMASSAATRTTPRNIRCNIDPPLEVLMNFAQASSGDAANPAPVMHGLTAVNRLPPRG